MSKNVNELAKDALGWFITDARDNGEEFIKTKEGRPDWLKNLIFTVHDGMLPDDYRYKFIEDALIMIADQDEDTDLDCPEIEADIYTSDLTKWLHSRNDRVYYLTEALETFEIKDGFWALQEAQLREREEVYYSVLYLAAALINSLRELCGAQEDEGEQEA
jgi:hypothetical protein